METQIAEAKLEREEEMLQSNNFLNILISSLILIL